MSTPSPELQTPDITKAQLVTFATAIVTALVVLFKLHLSDGEQAAAVTGLVSALGVAWQIADAVMRHGRAGIEQERIRSAAMVDATISQAQALGAIGSPPAPGTSR